MKRAILVLLAAAMLAGCGSGGGSNGSQTSTNTSPAKNIPQFTPSSTLTTDVVNSTESADSPWQQTKETVTGTVYGATEINGFHGNVTLTTNLGQYLIVSIYPLPAIGKEITVFKNGGTDPTFIMIEYDNAIEEGHIVPVTQQDPPPTQP